MPSARNTPDIIVTAFAWDDSLEGLYASWRRRVDAAEHVHDELAARFARRHAVLGAVAIGAILLAGLILLAPVVAPDAYARLTDRIDPDVVSVVGASLAAAAAVLLIVQAAARFAVRAEDHRIAALRYASLGRTMAITTATPREAREAPDDALIAVRSRVDRYSRESPTIGMRRRRKMKAEFERSTAPFGPAQTDESVVAQSFVTS
jgi:hypothetical protein